MTHKSGEKVVSEPFVSEFLSTTCLEFDSSSLAENLLTCLSFVAVAEALEIQALVSDDGLRGCIDDGDDNVVFSILGDTGRETHFWRDGKTGIGLVAVVNVAPGSEDTLQQGEIEKQIQGYFYCKNSVRKKALKSNVLKNNLLK